MHTRRYAMTSLAASLQSYLDAEPAVALVEVTAAKGSTPREKGAWMLVAPDRIFGTIGGGQLEFMAIDEARRLLGAVGPLAGQAETAGRRHVVSTAPAPDMTETTSTGLASFDVMDASAVSEGPLARTLDVPLGPEIGQCCGGRVALTIRPVDGLIRDEIVASARAEDSRRPHVCLFGGGHVGQALAAAFTLLPVHVMVVETRADALAGMPDGVSTRVTPVPEEVVREAPPGAAFVVLTHDHALDFLIAAEALRREDAAYVGMIGSKTKKATFRSWFMKTAGGTEEGFSRLVSPIGGGAVKDKRPAVIAALAAAEIIKAFADQSHL